LEGVPEETWEEVSWREGTKGDLGKRMVAVRAHRGTGSQRHSTSHSGVFTGPEGWLIGERAREREEGGEIKYYFSPPGCPRRHL
jgi:hypothetical protein